MSSANSTVIKKSGMESQRRDFSAVTEMPGGRATQEQLSMLYTRYHFASSFCRGKDVLEVACGAGLGLGYLGHLAKKVTGVDIDEKNLKVAKKYYQGRAGIELQRMNAHAMEFEDETFDVIILFEAIYYLKQPHLFLSECFRILRKKGILLINTVNPQWQDFNPSPFSVRYFGARELHALLKSYGFQVDLYGAFPVRGFSLKLKITSIIKRTARNFGLVPRTMKGKEFLKRIFFGRLAPISPEVHDGMAEYAAPMPLSPASGFYPFKVLYAVGQKGEGV